MVPRAPVFGRPLFSSSEVRGVMAKTGFQQGVSHKSGPRPAAEKAVSVDRSTSRRLLLHEQTKLLYRNQTLSLLANVALGLAVVLAHWDRASHARILIWFSALVLTVACRALLVLRYRGLGRHGHDDPARWSRYVVVGMAATGIIWGSAVIMLPLTEASVQSTLLLLVLTGVIIGAITASATYLPAVIAFLVPVVIPMAVSFLRAGGFVETLMGGGLLLSLGVLIRLAFNVQKIIRRAILLRHRNTALARTITRSNDELKGKSDFLQAVLDNIVQGVSVYDQDLRLIGWNRAYVDLMAVPEHFIEAGCPLRDLIAIKAERGDFGPGKPEDLIAHRLRLARLAQQGKPQQVETHLADGRDIEVQAHAMPDGGVIITHTDITERKRAIENIRYMAHHDRLTGLPNRTLFRKLLGEAVAHAQRNGTVVALMVLDIDDFKNVNDNFGHPAGDAALGALAHRLAATVRKTDVIARLGSDEFAIIGTNHNSFDGAPVMARKILERIRQPIDLDEQQIQLTASMGITVYPNDSGDVDQLLSNADLALYRAKSEGKNSFRLYDRSMQRELRDRQRMANEIRVGLELGQFELHYQPLIDLVRGDAVGVEALARWPHPEHGWVPPGAFIPVAESTRLIEPFSEWMLQTACADARAWVERGPEGFTLSVNISPVHFRSETFTQAIVQALEATGFPASRLELEITEGSFLDARTIGEALAELEKLGIRLAIDDFGTGYSSMAYLKAFPVAKLKIDRSFVTNITDDEENARIVEAIIRLGHSLGLRVVAEGVEDRAELEFLKSLRCDEAQGFYFARPMPACEFERFLGSDLVAGLLGT